MVKHVFLRSVKIPCHPLHRANVTQIIYTILGFSFRKPDGKEMQGGKMRKSHKRTISRLPSVRHLRTTVNSKYDTPFLYQPELSSRADCQVRFRVGTVSTYGPSQHVSAITIVLATSHSDKCLPSSHNASLEWQFQCPHPQESSQNQAKNGKLKAKERINESTRFYSNKTKKVATSASVLRVNFVQMLATQPYACFESI